MTTPFAPILVTATPGDVIRGWIGTAAKQGTDAAFVERVCRGLDWSADDVQRLTDNTVRHLGEFTDDGVVKRLASELGAHPLALSFRTRMVGDGFDMPEDEEEDGQPTRPVGFRFVMSDALPDRADDIVEQDWDLDEFRSNPIAPYNHAYWDLPVGRWAKVSTVSLSLRGTFVPFAPSAPQVHPQAVAVRELMEQRILVTCSVGFRPKAVIARASLDENDPKYGERGMVYMRNTLLECSPTPMPMNPRASRKSMTVEPAKKSAPPAPPPRLWGLALYTSTPSPWSS